MNGRFLHLVLLLVFLPSILAPGRFAVCIGDCGCQTSEGREQACENADAKQGCCCSCSCGTKRETSLGQEPLSCRCSLIESPSPDQRPSCPDCIVIETKFDRGLMNAPVQWDPQDIEIFVLGSLDDRGLVVEREESSLNRSTQMALSRLRKPRPLGAPISLLI